MGNYSASLDNAFRALADPTRRAVIARLVAGPAPVKELASPFDMGLPSFMKHLKVLEDSGLITSKKSGRVRTCHLKSERLSVADDWLATQLRLWKGRTDRLAHYVENNLETEDS